MRILVLFLLAVCFVSVSALSGYERASAANYVDVGAAVVSSVEVSSGELPAAMGDPVSNEMADPSKGECACKEMSGSLTLACGVTIALIDQELCGQISGARQTWFVFAQTDRNARMMYLLKRPPRTSL